MTREQTNERSLLAGNDPVQAGEITMRPITMESLSILQILGSRIYDNVMDGKTGEETIAGLGMYEMLEFVWVHSEDPDLVRRMALQAEYNKSKVREAVLKHGGGLSMETLSLLKGAMVAEKDAITASVPEVIGTGEGQPKN